MAIHSVEVFIVVDADGNYSVGTSEESAADDYANNVSENAAMGRRAVKVTINVPVPESLEIEVDVPEVEESEPTVTVA